MINEIEITEEIGKVTDFAEKHLLETTGKAFVVKIHEVVPPDMVIKIVCEVNEVTEKQITSKFKQRDISDARHMAVTLIKEFTTYPLKRIGSMFGRDHSTALHSIQKNNDYCKTDRAYLQKFDECKRRVEVYLDSIKN
jgi:chromosomal replication initiator protein